MGSSPNILMFSYRITCLLSPDFQTSTWKLQMRKKKMIGTLVYIHIQGPDCTCIYICKIYHMFKSAQFLLILKPHREKTQWLETNSFLHFWAGISHVFFRRTQIWFSFKYPHLFVLLEIETIGSSWNTLRSNYIQPLEMMTLGGSSQD